MWCVHKHGGHGGAKRLMLVGSILSRQPYFGDNWHVVMLNRAMGVK